VALAESLWVLKAALSIHDLYPLFLMEAKIASFDTQHSTEGSSTHTIRKVPTCVTAGIVIGKNCNVALLCV